MRGVRSAPIRGRSVQIGRVCGGGRGTNRCDPHSKVYFDQVHLWMVHFGVHPPAEGLSEIHKEMGGGGDVGSWTTKLYRDVHFAWSQTPKALPGRSFFMDFSHSMAAQGAYGFLFFVWASPPQLFLHVFHALRYIAFVQVYNFRSSLMP